MKSSNYPVISLFSGMGGIDIGLESAGFDIRVCIDSDDYCVRTIAINKPDWKILHEDISEISTTSILDEADLDVGEPFMVAGGPPCQPFSKSAFWVKGRTTNIAGDPRSKMLDEFARIVKESRPHTFLLENVSGLSYKTSKPILNRFLQSMEKIGYNPQMEVINAVEYGVPQKRKRLFIIGARDGTKLQFPSKTHKEPLKEVIDDRKECITALETIEKFNEGIIYDGSLIGEKYGHLLPEIPPGDNYLYYTKKRGHPRPKFRWRSKFWTFLLKLSPNLPSWTIQASPAKYQGPYHWNNRKLKIEELKALQVIPQDWKIYGNNTQKRKQIGNACPPKLTECIGKHILDQTS